MSEQETSYDRGPKNLVPEDSAAESELPSDPSKAVATAVATATKKAVQAIGWYYGKKGTKRVFGRIIRIAAIASGGGAAMLPVLSELYPPTADGFSLRPGWAAIAVIVGAGLVWIDHFFGFTSGWVRYVSTALRLTEALDAFRFDMRKAALGWNGGKPDREQAVAALELCRGFVATVNAEVRAESDAWAAEFRGAIAQVDESLRSRTEEWREASRSKTAPAAGAVPPPKRAPGAPPAEKSAEGGASG
jgi:hypothetical protein